MNLLEKYDVKKEVSSKDLISAGFRLYDDEWHYRTYLYKRLIQLHIVIGRDDKDDGDLSILIADVTDVDHDCPYHGYYNRYYGNNLIVDKLDKEIEKVINELIIKNILVRN